MVSHKSSDKNSISASELPELLTLKEASAILKVHANTLRQWDEKGILVALRFGARKDRKYRKNDILKLLNQKL